MTTTPNNADIFPWFALQIRPGYETVTKQLMFQKGYTPFVPTYKVNKRWSDRIKQLEQPLFPGYVFCRIDLSNRLPILKTPGVLQILGMGKIPEPVPEAQVAALQAIVISGLEATPCPFVNVGEPVRMLDGPLRGVEGIVVEVRNRARLFVSVPLLQRSISVEVDQSWVMPVLDRGLAALASPGSAEKFGRTGKRTTLASGPG
jgi:transcription antitermination factor NusG